MLTDLTSIQLVRQGGGRSVGALCGFAWLDHDALNASHLHPRHVGSACDHGPLSVILQVDGTHFHSTNTAAGGRSEEQAWLNMAPVGREFGSPDYERLTALDQAAFAAFQSWERVQHWLTTPNSQLDGACPDDAVRSPDGLRKVMSILMLEGGRADDNCMREAEKMPI